MKTFLFFLFYRFLISPIVLIVVFPILFFTSEKFRKGLKLRASVKDWPNFKHQPMWIHASSGEFEYAKPLIRELKKNHPSRPILVTYFSPTYVQAINNTPGVDFVMPLPIDLPGPTSQFIKKINPKMLLIARTDLWPEMLYQCQKHWVPAILFSARQSPISRFNFLKRFMLRFNFSFLNEIYCVSEEDRKALQQLNLSTPIYVAGDTRYDQVKYRLNNRRPIRDSLRSISPQSILIAGSTWPEDEDVLIEATASLIKEKKLKLILVPHEPEPNHIKSLLDQLNANGLTSTLYSSSEVWSSDVLLVDQVGILAELYTWAHIAYVGGSFKKGVHSVMEPLAAGLPTLVGPYFRNNREAIEFNRMKSQNIRLVRSISSADDLKNRITELLENQGIWNSLNGAILQQVAARTGATLRISESIRSL